MRQIIHDTVRVEEVHQEIWVQIWRSAGRYGPADGPVMPWIMTVAHRRAVDRPRSERFPVGRVRPADAGSPFPLPSTPSTARSGTDCPL
ncbi:sigma factor [Amycolatopsis sp. TNS106]|uniref:sigma factor n=1 Tax=Amycolatopsis sp. TNS106 TaxID=2861750 RepID=UPI002108339A|nr:sigma factor [Amycolatopsis sp. TNS106]